MVINLKKIKLSKTASELYELCTKFGTYIIVVILAIMGKLGMDLMNKKHISLIYVVGFTSIALFVSVMAYMICAYKHLNPVLSAVVVGFSTIFSRDIMVVIALLNWKRISQLNWTEVVQLLITKKRKS